LIEHRAAHIMHMQKALGQMNVQLTQAVKDITGVTGLSIIRAIVAGERDPHKLAALRQPGVKKNEQEIAPALTGNYRPEHLCALRQTLALYDAFGEQLRECDAEIERQFANLKPTVPPNDQAPWMPRRSGSPTVRMGPIMMRAPSCIGGRASIWWPAPA